MIKHKVPIIVLGCSIILACIILYVGLQSKPEVVGPPPKVAPDGIVYGELVNETIYSEEYYDETYGHFEDLVATSFDDVKPEYYSSIDFQELKFPVDRDTTKLFPGFIMWEAVNYASIPEEDMSQYFPDEKVEHFLKLEREGVEVNGATFPFTRDPAPTYVDVVVTPLEDSYRVTYVTTMWSTTKFFEIDSDGKLCEIEGSW